MSLDEIKAVAASYYASLDADTVDATVALFADDLQWLFTGVPDALNKEGMAGVVAAFGSAFSGKKHELRYQIAEGDSVLTAVTFNAKHTAAMGELPATDMVVAVPIIGTMRIKDGKIYWAETRFDNHDFLAQLGVV